MREGEIQKIICDYLTAKGVFWWRMHIGGVRRAGKGLTSNPLAGFPDVAGIVPKSWGALFCLEFKAKKGIVSDKQKEWYDRLLHHGVEVHIVRDLNHGIQIVDGW